MIRIRLPDAREATLEAHHWSSKHPDLARLLNAMLAPWEVTTREADISEAHVASKILGATIIEQA